MIQRLLQRLLSWIRGQRRRPVRVEFPRLARLRHVPILCPICSAPLLDQDLVTWHEAEGWKSPTYHARCTIFIVGGEPRAVRRLGGEEVPDGFEPPAGAILLTEREWTAWLATEGGQGGHVRRSDA